MKRKWLVLPLIAYLSFGFFLFIGSPNAKITSLVTQEFKLPSDHPHYWILESFLPDKRHFPIHMDLSAFPLFDFNVRFYNTIFSKPRTICIDKFGYKFPLQSTVRGTGWFSYSGFEYCYLNNNIQDDKSYPKLIEPSSFPYEITFIDGDSCEGEVLQRFRAHLTQNSQHNCTKSLPCKVWFEEIY